MTMFLSAQIPDVANGIIHVMKKNAHIEDLSLCNTGIKLYVYGEWMVFMWKNYFEKFDINMWIMSRDYQEWLTCSSMCYN